MSKSKRTKSGSDIGPSIFQNWKAMQHGVPRETMLEFPLYTDAHVAGQAIFGPYEILNTIADASGKDFICRSALVLRSQFFVSHVTQLTPANSSDNSRYHGGLLNDEICALISLCLGIRLRSGTASRRFDTHDPYGTPYRTDSDAAASVTRRSGNATAILPSAQGTHSLANIGDLLLGLPNMEPSEVNTLIIVTRTFQNALWLIESDPELSWLLLISAIETAANNWYTGKQDSVSILKESSPDIYAAVSPFGNELTNTIADILAPKSLAKRKFVTFLREFHPSSPPHPRPEDAFQMTWDDESMTRAFKTVYDHRCDAVHSGIPFPLPMCESPGRLSAGFFEKPVGIRATARGGTWEAKDLPMTLHIFEHIVRHSLLAWWKLMNATNQI